MSCDIVQQGTNCLGLYILLPLRVHVTIMMVSKILMIVLIFLVCIWRQLEKEGGSEFSFFRQDGSGIIAVRRGGFLKRNNSWRSCRNKTLHNGCHKLKLEKNTSFFVDKTEAISAIRNEIMTSFLEKYCLIFLRIY